jgi:uncharacterized protein DUF222
VQLLDLELALDEFLAADPERFADGESVLHLQRIMAKTEALVSRSVAAFDASKDWVGDGARSAASWIAAQARIPRGVAKRQVRLGRAAQALPAFAEAWERGVITAGHIEAVDRVRRFETEDLLERDAGMLLEHAETLPFNHFVRAVHYWEQHADPNGSELSADQQRARRDVFLVPSFDGMWLGKITLDPISGAIVSQELDRIEKLMFEEDWEKAKAANGGAEPTINQLCRTPQQRRADALVEMASRSAAAVPGSRRPDPLFTVLVDYETLHGPICQLAQGVSVTPGSLLRWLDSAYVERVVFGLGKRIEVSERARFFSGATRRALEVRDRECQHPLCDENVDRCEADHIQPFSEGGLTVQENGRMLCSFHNRLRNNVKDGWRGDDSGCRGPQDERPPPDG